MLVSWETKIYGTPEMEQAMREKNVPDYYIDSCKKIKYMFPKGHAAAYVMMALRVAWFKVYRPLEYYATFYTVRADNFDAILMLRDPEELDAEMKRIDKLGKHERTAKDDDTYTLLELVYEMRARGIEFLPVDLYKSSANEFLIQDGKIRYDGINITKIRKPDLRRSLGVVLQDVNLFTGTVMENLRYGNPDATDEDCIAAAKLANADGFIRMLPQGYNTVLKGDGSGLSQGQRQLISIARAAVSDPPVMILDEATSSIDTRTEALVQDGMDKLMKGRTVFVIAHRLSTVQNSDVIMVLDHGHIIERGNHEKLINEKGTYYQLYTGAFELE